MQGQAPYEIQVHWVYGPPLPVGLDPEARQAMIRERIARIFAQMSSDSGSPPETRERARPSRDIGSVGGSESDAVIALRKAPW